MREWYYIKDGQQNGPVDENTLISLFSSGELSQETKVWSSDFDEWTPARNVQGLRLAENHSLGFNGLSSSDNNYQPSGEQITTVSPF